MNVNQYHKVLGHPSEDTTRLTAKFYNLKLTRDWKVCTECALAKRMQRRLAREAEHTAEEPGGRMFLDLSSLNFTTIGGNRHIGLLVDEYSRLKFDMYVSTKDQLQEQLLSLLKIIFINYKIKVRVIQMDNAGENIYIEQAIRLDPVLCEMGTIVEYVENSVICRILLDNRRIRK